MKSRLPLLFVAVFFTACSPKIYERVRTEYVYKDRVQVDTTFLKDSVFIREQVKGDTVRIVEYRDRYHYDYKYLTKVDTVMMRDTVAIERKKEVKVEKKLSFWQRVKIGAFWWLFALSAGLLVWTFRKQILRLLV